MPSRGKGIGYRCNLALAKRLWFGQVDRELQISLRSLSDNYGLSVAAGDLQLLENRWYVTHTGLIRLAQRRGCSGINARPMVEFCDRSSCRWVFEAIVYKRGRTRGFTGYGDADPSNTSALVRGAEMRVAETRAVNRALRKAYGIGLCSVEELGSKSIPIEPVRASSVNPPNGSRSSNGQPRLRDKLCLLIRKHELDSNLVKRYAADFCGTEALRDAGKDLVEAFVSTIAEEAVKDRTALICKLKSYS
jgi:hypothetical protein